MDTNWCNDTLTDPESAVRFIKSKVSSPAAAAFAVWDLARLRYVASFPGKAASSIAYRIVS